MLTRVLTCGSVPGGSTAIVIVHRRRAGAPAISDSTPLEQTSMSSTHALMPNDMVLLCLKMRQTHLRLSPDRQTCPLKGVTRNIIGTTPTSTRCGPLHPWRCRIQCQTREHLSSGHGTSAGRHESRWKLTRVCGGSLVGLCEVKAPSCPPLISTHGGAFRSLEQDA